MSDEARRMIREQFAEWYLPNARGIITSPGKFEGQMIYVPYFWGMLGNDQRDDFEGVTRFDVTAEDRLVFPELAEEECVCLVENELGFVCECSIVYGPREESRG